MSNDKATNEELIRQVGREVNSNSGMLGMHLIILMVIVSCSCVIIYQNSSIQEQNQEIVSKYDELLKEQTYTQDLVRNLTYSTWDTLELMSKVNSQNVNTTFTKMYNQLVEIKMVLAYTRKYPFSEGNSIDGFYDYDNDMIVIKTFGKNNKNVTDIITEEAVHSFLQYLYETDRERYEHMLDSIHGSE